jgi:hypothetical protein
MIWPGVNTAPFLGGMRGVILTALLACEGNEYLALKGTMTSVIEQWSTSQRHFIREFKSVQEAAAHFKSHPKELRRAMRTNTKLWKGFVWKSVTYPQKMDTLYIKELEIIVID